MFKLPVLRFTLMLQVVILFTSCNYHVLKQETDASQTPQSFKLSELSFSSINNRVLKPNCVSCHGSDSALSLQTYEDVRSRLTIIRQAVLVERTMPKRPASPLTLEQIGLLDAWISAGAPETAAGESPVPPAEELEPRFASIKANILDSKCILCHSAGQAVARIPLVTKEDLLNSPLDLVIPGVPEESGLVLAIRGANPAKIMPPLKDENGNPTGFTKLTQEEIRAVVEWIQNGAKD